jgi:hypothetical protein
MPKQLMRSQSSETIHSRLPSQQRGAGNGGYYDETDANISQGCREHHALSVLAFPPTHQPPGGHGGDHKAQHPDRARFCLHSKLNKENYGQRQQIEQVDECDFREYID